MKKKILCTLSVFSLAMAGIFIITTNLFALDFTVMQAADGTMIRSWNDLDQLIIDTYTGDINQTIAETYTTSDSTGEEWWTHHTDVSDGTEIFIPADTAFGIFKAGKPFYFVDFRGVGDITLTTINGKDISSYAVPEGSTLIFLGLFLLSMVLISKKRFNEHRS